MAITMQLLALLPFLAASAGGEAAPGIADPHLPTWLWTWIVFGLVLLVLWKYAFGPLRDQLETRENRIRETVETAARLKREAEALLDKHREMMDRSRADAQEIIQEGRTAAERVRDEVLEQGRVESRELVDRAKREIDLERKKAIDEIRREAVDLTLLAASKVLERSLEDEDHRRLTRDVIGKLETVGEG